MKYTNVVVVFAVGLLSLCAQNETRSIAKRSPWGFVAKVVKDKAKEVGEKVANRTQEVAKEVGKSLQGFGELGDIADVLTQSTQDLTDGLQNTIRNAKQTGMKDAMGKVRRTMVTVYERFTDLLMDTLVLMGETAEETVEELIPVVKEAAKEAACQFVCSKTTDLLFSLEFQDRFNKDGVMEESVTEVCKPFCNYTIEKLPGK